jgi:hypothetical protein
MPRNIQEIVDRRTALEKRVRQGRAELALALDALAPVANVANRAASIAKFLRDRPLIGLLLSGATSFLLRKRASRWLSIASLATLATRFARTILRR